jgi:hypothetical protein
VLFRSIGFNYPNKKSDINNICQAYGLSNFYEYNSPIIIGSKTFSCAEIAFHTLKSLEDNFQFENYSGYQTFCISKHLYKSYDLYDLWHIMLKVLESKLVTIYEFTQDLKKPKMHFLLVIMIKMIIFG